MRRRGFALVAVMSLLLGACATSPESLENAVEDKPGVIKVKATEHEGDDGIPFEKVAKRVTVVMDGDASGTQIIDVFDAYDGDIDDGDVYVIEVVLKGPKRAVLSTGEGVYATRPMVDELVDAQHDDEITKYRREAYPVLPSVDITLATADYDGVVAVADRYRDVNGVDLVQVTSGDFLLIRDAGNADPTREAARERFALGVNRRFRLTGAVVTGRGPLRFSVSRTERAALQDYVERHASSQVGKIIVRAKD